jgi:hypothetical protein
MLTTVFFGRMLNHMRKSCQLLLSLAGLLISSCASTTETAPSLDDGTLGWNEGPRVPL